MVVNYSISILMIKKCASQVLRITISPLSLHSRVAIPALCHFSQEKKSFTNKGGRSYEGQLKQKPLSFNTLHLQSSPSSQAQIIESESYESGFGRLHGFKGQQRAYFLVIAGLLLAFNVAARLSISHEAPLRSYERKH